MGYEDSWLWQQAFVQSREDAPQSEQHYFRERYLSMREKAAALVGQIAKDMESMTVHDSTHLDTLWEMGSILTQNNLSLNPPEAFVFGGAVLLHDAAMTIAAYPNGLAGLRDTIVWKDSYARFEMLAKERPDSSFDKELVQKLATSEALRKLHALQAEKLPNMSWSSGGEVEFLIDESEVRNFYGPKIGQIAHSHWWSIAHVEENLANDLGPLGGRTSNRIDLIKIACLLRTSDAMHIDRRRAPSFLRKLLNPQGESVHHWAFQERMAVPFVEGEALVYSAAPAFELAAAEAWWLGFDALTMIDQELRGVDILLQRRGARRLNANRVKAITTPTELARIVETVDWVPVDSTVRVSDVPKIVSTLGGSKLYGDEPTAAIRELIQNAADAVDARRKLQKRSSSWGSVEIAIENRDGEYWLVVEDNGVGMSSAVLTGPLVDFGNSFWRSSFAAEEFPGIQALGVSAAGHYGIGFFSVFMLGRKVRVMSRRYDKSSDSVRTLEFQNGLESRPILYVSARDESPVDGGTRVSVCLDRDPHLEGGFLYIPPYGNKRKKFKHLIASIAPNLNVKLIVREDGLAETVVQPDDWLKLGEPDLMARLSASVPNKEKTEREKKTRLRVLADSDGNVFGRAMIDTSTYGSGGDGCITVGGLKASGVPFIRGVLIGREYTAARDDAYPIAPPSLLAEWSSEQAKLISKANLDGDDKARGAQVVLRFGGKIGSLPVARWNGTWISTSQLVGVLKSRTEIVIFFSESVEFNEDADDVHPRDFSNSFEDGEDVLFVQTDFPGAFSGRDRFFHMMPAGGSPRDTVELVRSSIEKAWNGIVYEGETTWMVGKVLGVHIYRNVTMFSRELENEDD